MPANPPIEWEDVARLSGTDDDCSFVCMCGTSKRGSGFAYHRVIRGTETMLKGRTGYNSAELDVVWEQVKDHLPRPKIGHDMTKAYFLLVFIVIHTGLRVKNRDLLSTPSTGTLSKSTYYKRVVPIMHAIAKHIDQIRPENRYKTNNHVLHFPKWVTGIVDCGTSLIFNNFSISCLFFLAAPIRITMPKRSRMVKKLFYGKYGYAVLKIQMIVSFLGEIVFASFPHLVCAHQKCLSNQPCLLFREITMICMCGATLSL